ncbi:MULTISPECIES: putative Ig domain-containing protein [unclassified Sphingopyxis]|uniref:putative Ig domain-containing protein n=1 Tax=unclassified Sphingopyxis TaxID=2614943 RepID=UPI000B1090B9|nr:MULTISPECIES: putative Ig domain-containing protein [unclassified Sphingopyxis]
MRKVKIGVPLVGLAAVAAAAFAAGTWGGGGSGGQQGGPVLLSGSGGTMSLLSGGPCDATLGTNSPLACQLTSTLSGTVTWSFVANAPIGMGIQPKSGQVRWTPAAGQARTQPYVVTAQASNGSQTENIDLTVTVNAGAADPAGIYVATNGNDGSGAGTAANPYKTLKKAVAVIGTSAGGSARTIYVRGGEYKNKEFGDPWTARSESSLVRIKDKDGTSTLPYTLRPFGNEYAKLSSDVTAISIQDSDYWTIQGLEIMGGAQAIDTNVSMALWWTEGEDAKRITAGGIQNNGSDHLTIRDNIVHDFPHGGINNRDMEFLTVENNIVYNNAWWTISGTNGISSVSMFTTTGNENLETVNIKGNLVFGNQSLIISHVFAKNNVKLEVDEGAGILLQNEGVTDVTPGSFDNKIRVEDNILAYNGKSGVGLNGIDEVTINRNSFYRNARVVANGGDIAARASVFGAVTNNLFDPRSDRWTIRSFNNNFTNVGANATTGTAQDNFSASGLESMMVLSSIFADAANGDFAPAGSTPDWMGASETVRDAIAAKLAEYGIVIASPTQTVDIAAMKLRIFQDWPVYYSVARNGQGVIKLDANGNPLPFILHDPVTDRDWTYAERCDYPGMTCS